MALCTSTRLPAMADDAILKRTAGLEAMGKAGELPYLHAIST